MTDLRLPALHHVALTVTDIDASIAWYERALGITFQVEAPHDGGTGMLLADPEWRLIVVLHRHDDNTDEAFIETRTGLDHVGWSVPSRADLDAWQAHLETAGVERVEHADRPLTQSPIADTPYGSVLVFRDPDNIQLELFSAPGT